ncbi:MAG: hypothetical protein AAF933_12425 [Pseudomonadota bacterium]
MSEVLGYDCDGNAVRAGDLVKIIDEPPEYKEYFGVVATAIGVDAQTWPGTRHVELDLQPPPGYRQTFCPFQHVRLVPDDSASWETIESQTQWRRPKVSEEVAA